MTQSSPADTMPNEVASTSDRVATACAGLARDPSLRLVLTITSDGRWNGQFEAAAPELVARCQLLLSTARVLGLGTASGEPRVLAIACDEGNLVVGFGRDGSGLLVVGADGASLGLTLARVRGALDLEAIGASREPRRTT